MLCECDSEDHERWDSTTNRVSPANVQFQRTVPSRHISCNTTVITSKQLTFHVLSRIMKCYYDTISTTDTQQIEPNSGEFLVKVKR